jgi:Derlin-2/3
MLLMTFLMSGPQQALVQGSGLVAAHLHFFLTDVWPSYGRGRNYLQTPAIIENLVGTTIPRIMHRAYGTAFQPATQRPGAGGSTSQASSSVLPESWRSRGTGHRLGGD